MLLPLTGTAAFAGEAQQQVLRLYEGLINKTGGIHGRPLHFEIHDDQSNPVVAVQIVNELLPKKPTVILGPSVAATCAAVSALLAKGPGTVNYCFSPVVPPPPGGSDLVMMYANGTAFLTGLRELKNAGMDVPVTTNPFNGSAIEDIPS